jgi:hypothetical protein
MREEDARLSSLTAKVLRCLVAIGERFIVNCPHPQLDSVDLVTHLTDILS